MLLIDLAIWSLEADSLGETVEDKNAIFRDGWYHVVASTLREEVCVAKLDRSGSRRLNFWKFILAVSTLFLIVIAHLVLCSQCKISR